MENLPFLLLAGLMLCTFFAVSFGSQKYRLPSVLLYIALGAAVSPFFLQGKLVHVAAEIGIVLLFFILGLEFPLSRMVAISSRIWPAGVVDVALNLGGSMVLALLFGLDFFSAFVIGSIAYATSSSISAKMLDERRRLANPEAEFILALLIFEDLVAPILVSFIAGISGGDQISATYLLVLATKILLLVFGAAFIGYFGFRRLNTFIGKHIQTDFMPLLTVGLALGYAGLAMALGLSEILGAFMAGVMLSESGRAREIEHMLIPARDLVLPFFFFWFGTTIDFDRGIPFMGLMAAIVLLAIAGKVITGYVGSRLFGLSPKVSCRAAFCLVQRGEFSAVIAALTVPTLRVFSGFYILITAFVGVYLFGQAPRIANWYQDKWVERPSKPSRNSAKGL